MTISTVVTFMEEPNVITRISETARESVIALIGAYQKSGSSSRISANEFDSELDGLTNGIWEELRKMPDVDKITEILSDHARLRKLADRVYKGQKRKDRAISEKLDQFGPRTDESPSLVGWEKLSKADKIRKAEEMCSGRNLTLEQAEAVLSAHTLVNVFGRGGKAQVVQEATNPWIPEDLLVWHEGAYTVKNKEKAKKAQEQGELLTPEQLEELEDPRNLSNTFGWAYLEKIRQAEEEAAKAERAASGEKGGEVRRITPKLPAGRNLGYTFPKPSFKGIPHVAPIVDVMEYSLESARNAGDHLFRIYEQNTLSSATWNEAAPVALLSLFVRSEDFRLKGDGEAIRCNGTLNWTEAVKWLRFMEAVKTGKISRNAPYGVECFEWVENDPEWWEAFKLAETEGTEVPPGMDPGGHWVFSAPNRRYQKYAERLPHSEYVGRIELLRKKMAELRRTVRDAVYADFHPESVFPDLAVESKGKLEVWAYRGKTELQKNQEKRLQSQKSRDLLQVSAKAKKRQEAEKSAKTEEPAEPLELFMEDVKDRLTAMVQERLNRKPRKNRKKGKK